MKGWFKGDSAGGASLQVLTWGAWKQDTRRAMAALGQGECQHRDCA